MTRPNVAIVGAGMAGASLAAELADGARVVLLEGEDRPGRHSTGRSAAFWSESYGGPLIQPLTTASGQLLAYPPSEFSEVGFLSSRGSITIAEEGCVGLLDRMWNEFASSGVAMERLDRAALEARIPGLKPDLVEGIFEPNCSDIDVAGLHAAYLRKARKAGVQILVDAAVKGAIRINGSWKIETAKGSIKADILVNAAGAWADEVAVMAGQRPLGVQPYRRTIAQLRVVPPAPDRLPLVIDAAGKFYFKPGGGGRLWVSPHDEIPSPPCDSAPEELDVALAVDRLERAVDWQVERVEHSWAGLRSFAPDRLPIYGFATDCDGFFWFVGQGGFGIQTAPAAALLGASLLLGIAPDSAVAAIDSSAYAPERLMN